MKNSSMYLHKIIVKEVVGHQPDRLTEPNWRDWFRIPEQERRGIWWDAFLRWENVHNAWIKRTFSSYAEYHQWWAKKSGFDNKTDYMYCQAKAKGFKDYTAYLNWLYQRKGFTGKAQHQRFRRFLKKMKIKNPDMTRKEISILFNQREINFNYNSKIAQSNRYRKKNQATR